MKILIIKPSSFGDIVQALPCAAALKQAYPGCEINWVVFSGWEQLFTSFPDVDKVYKWDRKKGISGFFGVLKEIRKTEFDLVIDLQGLLRSAFLAKFSKAKKKIGVPGMKENSSLFIKEVFPESANLNATIRNLETVRFVAGERFEPKVHVTVKEEVFARSAALLKENGVNGDYICLIPFARGKGKDWSLDNYNKLIRLFEAENPDTKIAILGSKVDYGKLKSANIADLCGKTDLEALAAVLSKSKVCVGADTGPMHLASILNVPSVFIFGASDINETSPYIGRFSLLINKENPKDLNKILPENVFTEMEKWIK